MQERRAAPERRGRLAGSSLSGDFRQSPKTVKWSGSKNPDEASTFQPLPLGWLIGTSPSPNQKLPPVTIEPAPARHVTEPSSARVRDGRIGVGGSEGECGDRREQYGGAAAG